MSTAFWRSFGMFETLDDGTLSIISGLAQRRQWQAGETIFHRGDPGDYLIALADGRVRLSVGTARGRELVLRMAEPGELLGEIALLDAAPRSADAVAAINTVGYVLHRNQLGPVIQSGPAFLQAVTHYLCRRLRETTDQMEGIALYGLEARLARFILFTLRQIHGDDIPPDPVLRFEISQSDIAAVLGASRPKVNRALQCLRDLGALQKENDAMICDVATLEQLAEPDHG
jgi:CRP-like cAMP-binding protein